MLIWLNKVKFKLSLNGPGFSYFLHIMTFLLIDSSSSLVGNRVLTGCSSCQSFLLLERQEKFFLFEMFSTELGCGFWIPQFTKTHRENSCIGLIYNTGILHYIHLDRK